MALMGEEFKGIFEAEVLPAFHARSEQSDEPVLILLGGQPGSGKSTAASSLIAECGNLGKVAHLEGDLLRRHHPAFNADLVGLGELPTLTDPFVRAWLVGLLDEAFSSGRSILLESTWWSSDQVMFTVGQALESGFRVDAHALVVSPAESLVSTVDRFLRGQHFTRLYKHDRAVQGVPVTLQALLDAGVGVSARNRFGAVTGDPVDVLRDVWDSTQEGLNERRFMLAERLRTEFPDDLDVQDIRAALLDDSRFQAGFFANVPSFVE